jgi:hypothetical protein
VGPACRAEALPPTTGRGGGLLEGGAAGRQPTRTEKGGRAEGALRAAGLWLWVWGAQGMRSASLRGRPAGGGGGGGGGGYQPVAVAVICWRVCLRRQPQLSAIRGRSPTGA